MASGTSIASLLAPVLIILTAGEAMRRILLPTVLVAMLGTSAAVFAGDAHQSMKDCMDQQKATNPSMSREDLKKACKQQIKMSKSSATPNQTTPTTTGNPAPQSGSETDPPTTPPK